MDSVSSTNFCFSLHVFLYEVNNILGDKYPANDDDNHMYDLKLCRVQTKVAL